MSEQNQDYSPSRAVKRNCCLAGIWFCVWGILLAGCSPTVKTVRETSDQTKLARFAVESSKVEIRRAAVERLADQALLATIATNDKDDGIRRAAVRRVVDQRQLASLVLLTSPFDFKPMLTITGEVCRIAMAKLTNQALLVKVAGEVRNSEISKEAVERITDPDLRIQAKMWTDWRVTKDVTNQALIEELAMHAGNSSVQKSAVTRLTNVQLLASIMMDEKSDSFMRRPAAETFVDQMQLKDQTLSVTQMVSYACRYFNRGEVERLSPFLLDVVHALQSASNAPLVGKIFWIDGRYVDMMDATPKGYVWQSPGGHTHTYLQVSIRSTKNNHFYHSGISAKVLKLSF